MLRAGVLFGSPDVRDPCVIHSDLSDRTFRCVRSRTDVAVGRNVLRMRCREAEGVL